jgi:hypothetical protein
MLRIEAIKRVNSLATYGRSMHLSSIEIYIKENVYRRVAMPLPE